LRLLVERKAEQARKSAKKQAAIKASQDKGDIPSNEDSAVDLTKPLTEEDLKENMKNL